MLKLQGWSFCFALLQICDAYSAVSSRIHEAPNNIEELTELREWMKAVPEQLAVQEVGYALPMGTKGSGEKTCQCNVWCLRSKNPFFLNLFVYVCKAL